MEENAIVIDWSRTTNNPFENVWSLLGENVWQCDHPPQSQQQLQVALSEEWAIIPQDDNTQWQHRSTRRTAAVVLVDRLSKMCNSAVT